LKKKTLEEALKSKQKKIKKWGSNPKQIKSGGHNYHPPCQIHHPDSCSDETTIKFYGHCNCPHTSLE